MKPQFFSVLLCLFFLQASSQKATYTVQSIPDSLRQHANAVVRLCQTDITINSQRSVDIAEKRVVTVLNEQGQNAIGAVAYYNKRFSVNSIGAVVYDAFGNELKKIKRKDFRDQSVFDGISIALDGRLLFLDYTPTQYPFTIVYECEISTSNTAFIPDWQPLEHYFVGVEKSILNVTYPPDLGFYQKEYHFSGYRIEKTADATGKLSYTATNIAAQKRESYSPEIGEMTPKVVMALEYFSLEGIDGHAKDWKEFGQWYATKILSGTTDLPEATKSKIIALVGNEQDPIEKARIVYDYVQQKSRYVSIQLGIGGWKPMLASDVDRLGYGDCKALTNYTKALLDVVGVPSYNTILYGTQRAKKDINPDVVSVQGNHMMLAIPDGTGYTWLECTSQDVPFGYQAVFTDDRNVLVVKPDGAEIVRTKKYDNKDNLQITKGSCVVNEKGDLLADLTMVSEGATYNEKYRLPEKSQTDKEAHYKENWSHIGNLKINEVAFENDRRNVRFTEKLKLGAANYGAVSGNKMLLVVNAFDPFGENIKRIRNRKTPFLVHRGFYDTDEIALELPTGFAIESLPADFSIESKYGLYKTQLVKIDATHLLYKRSFAINKGLYSNAEYEDYRQFIDQVVRNDNAKIVLTKI